MIQVREVRGERVGTSHRKPKTYGKGRTCNTCGCELNSWDPGDTCLPHTSSTFRKYRARAT